MPPRDDQRPHSLVDRALRPRPVFVPSGRAARTTFCIAFDHAPGTGHDDKFEAVSSVYRLRQSQCFLESEGSLTCERATIRIAFHAALKRPRIMRRSAASATGGKRFSGRRSTPLRSDCAGCHMPKRRAEDTPRHGDDRPSDPAPSAAGDLLAEFRERAARGISRPSRAVLSRPPAAHAGERAVSRGRAGRARKQYGAGMPVLAREIAAQQPANPSSTWCSEMRG